MMPLGKGNWVGGPLRRRRRRVPICLSPSSLCLSLTLLPARPPAALASRAPGSLCGSQDAEFRRGQPELVWLRRRNTEAAVLSAACCCAAVEAEAEAEAEPAGLGLLLLLLLSHDDAPLQQATTSVRLDEQQQAAAVNRGGPRRCVSAAAASGAWPGLATAALLACSREGEPACLSLLLLRLSTRI